MSGSAGSDRKHGRRVERKVGSEGVDLGLLRALISLLENKFGGLSPAQRERIQRGSPAELKTWLPPVLDAASIDDVLNPAP